MESAIIGALLKITLPKVLSVLGGSRDVRSIQSELRYIEAAIQDHRKKTGKDTSHLRAAWIEDLRLFAFDIEDCVDRFLQQCMPEDGEAGLLLRSARAAKNTVFTRTWFSLKIRKLKTRSEEIHRRLKRYIEEETKATPNGAASIPAAGAPPASSAHAECGAAVYPRLIRALARASRTLEAGCELYSAEAGGLRGLLNIFFGLFAGAAAVLAGPCWLLLA